MCCVCAGVEGVGGGNVGVSISSSCIVWGGDVLEVLLLVLVD